MSDVNHPAHYGGGDNPREAIKVIESLGLGWGFSLGNALKYLLRAGKKTQDPIPDLQKALWYIRRAIALHRSGALDEDPEIETSGIAPDADRLSRVVLLVNREGPPTLLSSPIVDPFLKSLVLVQAGCPPTWKQGGQTPRFWRGEIDLGSACHLRVAFTPFAVPVIVLQEVHEPGTRSPLEDITGAAENLIAWIDRSTVETPMSGTNAGDPPVRVVRDILRRMGRSK